MADIDDFVPVTQETIDTIRARMDADVNAGLDPADPRWRDTTQGGFYWDITQTVGLEIERLWDMLGTEVPAAVFPEFSWGIFLDYHASTYSLTRKAAVSASGTVRFTGTVGTGIPTGTQVGTEPTDPDDEPLVYQTTESGVIPGGGFIDLDVQALETGSDSNVAVGVVSVLLSGIDGIASVSNTTVIASGEDIETDAALQGRIETEIASTDGAGTDDDYTRWALAYPGVGNVTVQALWAGGGTVRVVITDSDNEPVAADVVSGLQAQLDPVTAPGAGQGLAPIGAVVTVATPTFYYVNTEFNLVYDSGYSLDGGSGAFALRSSIVAAVEEYVDGLAPGAAVLLSRVEAAVLTVQGVHDISTVQLAGYLTQGNATSQTSPDRDYAATNLPVPSSSVASLVRTDPS